jgi:uncharacterized membrane protein
MFGGDPSNYFDPGYGFVPTSGYLNSFSPTVTISDSAVEFGYDDGASRISADFSGTHLTISDLIEIAGPTNSFQLLFTDSAFAGLSISNLSDTFPVGSYSLAGDTITLNYPSENPSAVETLTTTFSLASAPEPATLGNIFVAGAAALALFVRRKKV